jgi:AmmeMemoRadiSam system protein A/AmmeMemoRadiSam system protein B
MSIVAAYIVPHPPLIVPAVGGGEERKIRKTVDSYHQAARQIGELKPDTVVVITPHSVMYQDYIHISPGSRVAGNLNQFGDYKTRIEVDYDSELVTVIEQLAEKAGIAAGTSGERDSLLDHGTLVPLYFIDQYLKNYRLVRIGISGLPAKEHYRFGECIKEAAAKLFRRVAIVASGDLSHKLKQDGPYGFAPEGPDFDEQVTQAMANGDFPAFMEFSEEFTEAAAECGLRSFIMMAGALAGTAVNSELLSYEGPFGVGYAVAAFLPVDSAGVENEEIRKSVSPAVDLARMSLESYVRDRKYINLPAELPAELKDRRAGVFVSIKKDTCLRGCIGTIYPVESSIAAEIIRNAVSAGTCDPRFEPVEADELDKLVYSVDILGETEPISSIAELDVHRYGVIVSQGRKRGLLLPNLEGVTTPQQQVEIALQKAGISPGSSYSLERFEVVRYQ